MPLVTWYWVKDCPWGFCKDYKYSCGQRAWSKTDKQSRSLEGLEKKLKEHNEGSGLHWNAPDDMKQLVVDRALIKKVCHAQFDEDHNMVEGSEVLAASSGESEDEAYAQMMRDRKLIGSPSRRKAKDEEKPKKRKPNNKAKRRKVSSPSPPPRAAGGVWADPGRGSSSSTTIQQCLEDCLDLAADAKDKSERAMELVDALQEKLEDLADAIRARE